MFSGIVDSQGIIREFARGDESATMVVEMETGFSNLEDGESIAVNGVCLTVVEFDRTTFKMDFGTETLSKTSFRNSKIGDRVNLERSLTPSSKISGHFVSGHVDQVGEVLSVEENREKFYFNFRILSHLAPLSWRKVPSHWMESA